MGRRNRAQPARRSLADRMAPRSNFARRGHRTDPVAVTKRALELLKSPLLARDPGIASCLVGGLASGARVELEAAQELLSAIASREGSSVAEAFRRGGPRRALMAVDARVPAGASRFAPSPDALGAAGRRRPGLSRERAPLRTRPLESLAPSRSSRDDRGARGVRLGRREARVRARAGSARARPRTGGDASKRPPKNPGPKSGASSSRSCAISISRCSSRPSCPILLALDRKPADAAASIPAVEELHDRLCHQFLAWEAAAVVPLGERPVHPTIRLRRLRALIHLLDVDAEEGPDVGLRARVSRDRWLRASHTVLRRLVSDPPSVFRRSLAAALARALEGLVRAEVCNPSMRSSSLRSTSPLPSTSPR